MGWAAALIIAAILLFFLLRFAAEDQRGRWLAALTVITGLSGYLMQGSPSLPGVMIRANVAPGAPVPDAMIRSGMQGNLGSENAYLDLADALMRVGHTQAAVMMMDGGVKKYPESPDLWVGLGNALVVHGKGMVSPAATFAFDKARALAPGHPGPDFFTGLAHAQAGRLDEARHAWQALLARSPADAPWRQDTEARIKAIDAALAGQLQGP